jgi:hypothetical protein
MGPKTYLFFWDALEERIPFFDYADNAVPVDQLVQKSLAFNLSLPLEPPQLRSLDDRSQPEVRLLASSDR